MRGAQKIEYARHLTSALRLDRQTMAHLGRGARLPYDPTMVDIAELKKVALFSRLNPEHLDVLRKNLRPLSIEAGEALVTEGVTTRGPLMIILDGNVEVSRKDPSGTSRTLALIEAPTVIGEIEFLADVQSSATVTAHDDITGFVLARDRFDALLDAEEPAAFHLARAIGQVVSERLVETNRMLSNALVNR